MNLHHTKRDKPALISKWPTNTETFVAFGFIFTVFRAHFFEKHAKSGQQSWYTTWFQGNVRPLANCESKSGLSQFFQGLILVRLQDSKNHRKVTISDYMSYIRPIRTRSRIKSYLCLLQTSTSIWLVAARAFGAPNQWIPRRRRLHVAPWPHTVEYVGSQEKHVQDIIFLWE